jgi:hypothetical protein
MYWQCIDIVLYCNSIATRKSIANTNCILIGTHEPIYYEEYKSCTPCYNAGMFCLKDKGRYYDCHGYDFKLFYAREFPKNGLIKSLSSAGWGYFNDVVTICKTEDELIEFAKDYLDYSVYVYVAMVHFT